MIAISRLRMDYKNRSQRIFRQITTFKTTTIKYVFAQYNFEQKLFPDNDPSLETPTRNNESIFSFKYTETGGLNNRYLLISCDSATKEIKSSTDITSSNFVQKTLTDSDEIQLKECFEENRFFELNADYPSEKSAEMDDSNLFSFTLVATLGNRVHTVIWTNKSKNAPEELKQIKNKVKEIASSKKMI
jgi:hypothetical protein